MEYVEERPPLISSTGMASKIVTFARSSSRRTIMSGDVRESQLPIVLAGFRIFLAFFGGGVGAGKMGFSAGLWTETWVFGFDHFFVLK